MATATASSTPNPDAMKYTLDVRLPAMVNVLAASDATDPLSRAIFAAPGVAGVFAVNDFVTVTRVPGADWEPITAAVVEAVAGL